MMNTYHHYKPHYQKTYNLKQSKKEFEISNSFYFMSYIKTFIITDFKRDFLINYNYFLITLFLSSSTNLAINSSIVKE